MEVGPFVRDARRSLGLTQAALAAMVGTTQAAISRLEHDGISPTVDTLERVLVALGRRLVVSVEPVEVWADDQQLAAAARRSPAERIDHAAASMRGVGGLVGTARHGATGRG